MFFANCDTHSGRFQTWVGFGCMRCQSKDSNYDQRAKPGLKIMAAFRSKSPPIFSTIVALGVRAEISSIRSIGNRARLENLRRQFDARGEGFHAVAHLFERVQLHVFALAASAVVRRHPHHVEDRRAQKFSSPGHSFCQRVDDARLGHDDEPLRRGKFLQYDNHLFRRANGVGQYTRTPRADFQDERQPWRQDVFCAIAAP